MRFALLWLATREARRTGWRSGLTALALALTIIVMAVLERQTEVNRAALVEGYEAVGATTFIAQVSVPDTEIDELVKLVRTADVIAAVEAPYRSSDIGMSADTSFLVFQNEKQQEYLGARTVVLGVGNSFDLARDYYETMGPDIDPQAALGIPLLVADGATRAPAPKEVLIPAAVAEYVGLRPGVRAIVELVREAGSEGRPLRRYEDLEVIGTFAAVGPDESRFAPFWRLASRGREVLTVRRDDQTGLRTTLPIVLSAELLRPLVGDIRRDEGKPDSEPPRPGARRQLVIRAKNASDIATALIAVKRVLAAYSLDEVCPAAAPRTFCLSLPARNNFRSALFEQQKFNAGAGFFATLLLVLGTIGNVGLQLQNVINHWRDHAILQALGFTPAQIVLCSILLFGMVFGAGTVAAGMGSAILAPVLGGSVRSFAIAAAVTTTMSLLAAVGVLLWPLSSHPGERLRELT